MKTKLLLSCLLFGGMLSAQTLIWNNPSFEGTAPGSSISPPNWPGCQGSPDTQPGCWGATLPAAAGSSYLGIVYWTSSATTQESAGQTMPMTMVSGTTYSFSVRLVNLDIYNGSWNGGAIINIYGGASGCAFTQLLWSSGNFVNSTWQTYNAVFTAAGNWNNFIIRIHPGVGSTWPSAGVDNLLSIILPVKLEHFDVQMDEQTAVIGWQTSEEQNLASYTVQRAGSDMDFEDLATVSATGADGLPQVYEVRDAGVPKGLSYYRLRMVDHDGTETLSEVRALLNGEDGQRFAFKAIFPNPTSDLARLDVYSLEDDVAEVLVTDVAGRLVHRQSVELQGGENTVDLETSTWSPGMYHVQLKAGTTVAMKMLNIAR